MLSLVLQWKYTEYSVRVLLNMCIKMHLRWNYKNEEYHTNENII